jgi:transcriptional regulator with XRE-family HTH domain
MQAMPLSQQDLAAALGVDPSWVTRYKAKGLPTHSIEAAKAWRRDNVRPRVNPTAAGDGAGGRVPPAPPPVAGGGGDGDYWKSRARREEAEAELAELKLSEQRGELVRAADVRAAYAKKAAALREALLQIPARLAAVLAAETDHSKCHDTLQLELHQVLAQVTES